MVPTKHKWWWPVYAFFMRQWSRIVLIKTIEDLHWQVSGLESQLDETNAFLVATSVRVDKLVLVVDELRRERDADTANRKQLADTLDNLNHILTSVNDKPFDTIDAGPYRRRILPYGNTLPAEQWSGEDRLPPE